MEKRKDIKFLEFLEPKEGVIKNVNITDFMMKEFDVPDLQDFTITHSYFTDAVKFLARLKQKGLILFDDAALENISTWTYKKDGKETKHWFNTLPMTVTLDEYGLDYLYEFRNNQILLETNISSRKANESALETNKSVRSNNRNTFKILILTAIISAVNLGVVIKNYFSDNDKLQLRTLIQSQSRQLTEQQSIINQQQLILSHLIGLNKKP
jgi:hypothetical protein